MFPEIEVDEQRVGLKPGDRIYLYTDGIPEAQNSSATLYGEDRLLACVRANLGRSSEAVRDAILADVRRFTGDAPRLDDITLVVIARE